MILNPANIEQGQLINFSFGNLVIFKILYWTFGSQMDAKKAEFKKLD